MEKNSPLSLLRPALLLGLVCCADVTAWADHVAPRPVLPNIRFTRNLKNSEIIPALGGRIEGVAQHHGHNGTTFRELIKRDRCLCADRQVNLYYACDPVAQAGSTVGGTASSSTTGGTAAASLPGLHSRPNSQRKIFLDFDGHTTTSTSWNTNFTGGAAITTPAYDTDGNPTSLSEDEAARIETIWKRVAEDFAPFDVDVTTEDPGVDALTRSSSTDAAFGMRVCIGGSSYDWFAQGAGGVAYLGSFAWTTSTPCFVFPAQLGNGEAKYTAEAVSHEVGHTVGLNHDGVIGGTEYYGGHGDWAPLMGAGYYKAVTQWSKGEYPNASNTQDDLAVMSSYGLAVRADDHASAQSGATGLSGTTLSSSGVITNRGDLDLFRFACGAGDLTLNANPAVTGANLDIQLALYDNAGTLITSANPTGLSATISASLPAGTYYVGIDGVGAGDAATGYNDYASLGVYTLSGSVPAITGLPPVASVTQSAPTTGTAPLTVNFSSSGSFDPDGTISGFRWDFGDGTPVETVPNPTHVYQRAGIYTASLIVTDNSGLTASATTQIQVNADNRMRVSLITLSSTTSSRGTQVTARVVVLDASGRPVPGATVSAAWSGLISKNVSAKTSTAGVASFVSATTRQRGVLTFTVNNILKSGLVYTPSLNTETAESITIP